VVMAVVGRAGVHGEGGSVGAIRTGVKGVAAHRVLPVRVSDLIVCAA
jgi:hypothetical protein